MTPAEHKTTQRLFLAIEACPAWKAQIASLQQPQPGVRWVPPDNLHITLFFIGSVDTSETDRIINACRRVKEMRFEIRPEGVGVFPSRSKPRILWMGLLENEAITLLRNQIAAELAAEDFGPAEHDYHPHLTLARLTAPAKTWAQSWLQIHNKTALCSQLVDHFTLFESLRTSNGMRYKPLKHFPLSR